MDRFQTPKGVEFVGSPDFISGVIVAASVVHLDIQDKHIVRVGQYIIESCSSGSGPGWTSCWDQVRNRDDLLDYIADLRVTYPENEENTIKKRYVHIVLYNLCEKDMSYYELYQFDSLDFVAGIKAAAQKLNLTINCASVLDTQTYTRV